MAVKVERQSGRAASTRRGAASRWTTTETKHAFKTTEFWAMLGVIAGILIASWVVDGDDGSGDAFPAQRAWLYVAIVAGAYFVSRGLAKAGSYEPDESSDHDYDVSGGRDGD